MLLPEGWRDYAPGGWIKPGTAARLGLRPSGPRALIQFDRHLSEVEVEAFRASFQKAVAEYRPTLLTEFAPVTERKLSRLFRRR